MKCLFLLALVLPLQAAEPLRSVVEILKLGRESTFSERPVRIQGVVTVYDKRSDLFFIHDGTGGIYNYSAGPDLKLQPGRMVTIEGMAARGLTGPIVMTSSVQLGTNGPLPEPRYISMARLSEGVDDSQWVEVEGMVISKMVIWEQLHVELQQDNRKARILILKHDKAAPLVEEKKAIRVRGVVGASFDNQKRPTGYHVYVPNEAFVFPVSALAASSNTFVRTSTTNLAKTPVRVSSSAGEPVASGKVTLHWPGRMLMIRTGAQAFRVELTGVSDVQPGDEVDVSGAVHQGRFSPVVRLASVRLKQRGTNQPASSPPVAEILAQNFEGAPVALEARLVREPEPRAPNPSLLLEYGGRIFEAMLPSSTLPAGFAPGAVVRINGVVETEPEDPRVNDSLRVWVYETRGLELVSSPVVVRQVPLGQAVGVGAACMIGLGAFITLMYRRCSGMRRESQRRLTEIQRRETEWLMAFPEGVLRLDMTGRIRWMNPSAEKLLGFKDPDFSSMSLTRVVAPQHWERLRKLMDQDARSAVPSGPFDLELIGANGDPLHVRVTCRHFIDEAGEFMLDCILRDQGDVRRSEAALRSSEQQLRASLQHQGEVARDLHDNIIQSLYAAGLGIEAARGQIRTQPQQAEERLARGITDLNTVLRDIRGFLAKLSVDADSETDLESSLQALVITLSRAQSTRFILDIDPLACGRLDQDQVQELVCVAREAMTNCLKHSKAGTAVVTLRSQDNGIRFEVRDDGAGFDVNRLAKQGHGLRNIASRAQRLAATFEVNSGPGSGTQIILILPAQTNTHHDSHT